LILLSLLDTIIIAEKNVGFLEERTTVAAERTTVIQSTTSLHEGRSLHCLQQGSFFGLRFFHRYCAHTDFY